MFPFLVLLIVGGVLAYAQQKRPPAGAQVTHAVLTSSNGGPPVVVPLAPGRPGFGAFDDLPDDVVGSAVERVREASSGSTYVIALYPPNGRNETFSVAQLQTFGGPAAVTPYAAWIRWYQDKDSGLRRFDRASAPGDEAASAALVSIMMDDFAIPPVEQGAELVEIAV